MTEFSDEYGRTIDYLRISITDRCNLRCHYCMPPQGVEFIDHNQVLRYEEIVRIVKAGVELGIKKVRLTGGEPLVRKGVVNLVRKLNQISGIEEITLTTNGILLSEYGSNLVEAGLERVNISLDTLQEDKFERITLFEKHQQVLSGIKTALKVGLDPVKVNVVVMKGINDDEVLDFVDLTRKYPLHVRFIEFMPSGNKKHEQQKRYLGIDKVKKIIKTQEKLLPTKFHDGNGPAYYYQVKESLGTIGFITPISNHFCGDCNRLRLTVTGKLRSCLCSEEEVDLKEKVQQGTMGELQQQFMKAIKKKPESHSLNIKDDFVKSMSQIGG